MNTMTSDERIAILARMADTAPTSLGRTQVMKLFYFLQELKGVPLGYDFRLFTYGPFDSEVLSDLSFAYGSQVVTESTVHYPKGYGYKLTIENSGKELSDKLATESPDLAANVDAVVKEFGSYGAGELELLSTILFVDREFSDSSSSSTVIEIATRVHRIKPHFDEGTIATKVAKMQDKGFLKSVT
jgi:uncharacterized protein